MPTFRDENGAVVHVDDRDVATATAAGWTPIAETEEPGEAVGVQVPGYGFTAGTTRAGTEVLGVSPETEIERAKRAIRGYEEEQLGGFGGQVLAGIEGGLETATGGLSTALAERFAEEAGAGEEFREERARAREINLAGRVVGQIAGAVLPQGLAARVGTRAAGALRGVGAGRGTAAVAAGAFEGAIQSAGNSLADQALSGRPYSAEALAAAALGGAAFGGAAGGLVSLGGGALSRIGRRDSDQALRALATSVEPPPNLDRALSSLSKEMDAISGPQATIPWSKLYTRAEVAPQELTKAARATVAEIAKSTERSTAAREAIQAITDPVQRETALGALDAFEAAATEARAWAKPMALATTGKERRSLPALLREDPDVAVTTLSRYDAAARQLDDAIALRVSTPPIPGTTAAGAPARAAPRPGSRAAETAADVAAGAELLGEVTGQRPSDLLAGVPIVGDVTSLYLKYRALKGIVGKGARASRSAKAAAATASVGNRLADAAARAGRAIGSPRMIAGVGAGAGVAAGQLLDFDRDRLLEQADDAAVALPDDIAAGVRDTATRAVDYLDSTKPTAPLADTPFSTLGLGVPPEAAREWLVRKDAVLDAPGAAEDVLSLSHPLPFVAVDAIRNVYPALFLEIQTRLTDHIDTLIATRPESVRAQLGALWDVPLTPAKVPGALHAVDVPPPAPPPAPSATAPSGPPARSELAASRRDQRGDR